MNYFSIAYKTILCALLAFSNTFGMEKENNPLLQSMVLSPRELTKQNYLSLKKEVSDNPNASLQDLQNYLQAQQNYNATLTKTDRITTARLTTEIASTKRKIEDMQRSGVIQKDENELKNLLMETQAGSVDLDSFKQFSAQIRELKKHNPSKTLSLRPEQLEQRNSPKTAPTIESYKQNIEFNTERLINEIKKDKAFSLEKFMEWKRTIDEYIPESDALLQPYRKQVVQALEGKEIASQPSSPREEEKQRLEQNAHFHISEGRGGAALWYESLAKQKEAGTMTNQGPEDREVTENMSLSTTSSVKELQAMLSAIPEGDEFASYRAQINTKIKTLSRPQLLEEIKEMEDVANKVNSGEIKPTSLTVQELLALFPTLSNFITENYYENLFQLIHGSPEEFSSAEILKIIKLYEHRITTDRTWLWDNNPNTPIEELGEQDQAIVTTLKMFVAIEKKYSSLEQPTKQEEEKKEQPSSTVPVKIAYKNEYDIQFNDIQRPNKVANDQKEIFEPLAQKTAAQTERIEPTKKSVQIQRNQPEQKQPAPDNNEPWTFSGVAWSIVAAPFRLIGGVFNWLASWFA